MKRIPVVALLSAISIASGCAPTEQQYAVIQETVRGSEKARQMAISQCLGQGWNRQAVRNASIVLNTSEKAAPGLACRRFVDAIRSGRMTYADAVAFKRNRPTPELIRIFQGR